MDSYALLAGDLLAWVDSIDADEKYEMSDTMEDGQIGRTVHLRAGLVDVMVKPKGVNPETGTLGYEITAHSHDDMARAVECFRTNREGNERRDREWKINPERAMQRAMAERQGIPQEVIDAILPINGTGALDQARERLQRERSKPAPRPADNPYPVSGGPTGWGGPANWGDDTPPQTGLYP